MDHLRNGSTFGTIHGTVNPEVGQGANMHMQDVLKRYEIPLTRYFEQIALTLEQAGAHDEITVLRLQYAPNLFVTWRKGSGPAVEGQRVPTPEHLRNPHYVTEKSTITIPSR